MMKILVHPASCVIVTGYGHKAVVIRKQYNDIELADVARIADNNSKSMFSNSKTTRRLKRSSRITGNRFLSNNNYNSNSRSIYIHILIK